MKTQYKIANEISFLRAKGGLFGHFARVATGAVLACWVGTACGGRSEKWDAPLDPGSGLSPSVGPDVASDQSAQLVSLKGSLAVHDRSLNRVSFITVPGPERVEAQSFQLGADVTAFRPSIDRSSLFVLSRGVQPRTEPDDEKPRLQMFSGGKDANPTTYELDDPMSALSLDPEGQWVAAFAGDATVTNANEIVLLDLKTKGARPFSKTIRSFGGVPVELVFTSVLTVPRGEPRRFLVARTDRDIALIDLAHLDREEVTVKLPKDATEVPLVPAEVVFDDGDPDDPNDALLGVRLQTSSDVVLLQFAPPTSEAADFSIVPNIVDVGGVPSAIDFVRTDGGLRLAALVPSRQRASLVDPKTTASEVVELGGTYTNMRRITGVLSAPAERGDVALLWGQGKSFAFWSLGSTSGTPYRAIDTTQLDISIDQVIDVPPPHQHLKILTGSGSNYFYVLDLERRESSPLKTEGANFRVEPSQDGTRLWAFSPGQPEFSSIRLSDLHPNQLYVTPSPQVVVDLERGDGGRAALAVTWGRSLGATLLDGNNPDSARTLYFPSLHLEGIQ